MGGQVETDDLITHVGGCHCGRVRFEVHAPAQLYIDECNCSMCSRTAYLHLIVTANRFRITQGEGSLTLYTFNTGTAKHFFCSHCGIKPFYVPRSHPDGWSVNARCIDAGTVAGMSIHAIDGRNWEAQYPQGRGEFVA
jgi:hypothetical protein